MDNTKIVELLTQVLRLINKLDDNSLMSMNGIARRRAESLENYRREIRKTEWASVITRCSDRC